jgi:hypothetical protein
MGQMPQINPMQMNQMPQTNPMQMNQMPQMQMNQIPQMSYYGQSGSEGFAAQTQAQAQNTAQVGGLSEEDPSYETNEGFNNEGFNNEINTEAEAEEQNGGSKKGSKKSKKGSKKSKKSKRSNRDSFFF